MMRMFTAFSASSIGEDFDRSYFLRFAILSLFECLMFIALPYFAFVVFCSIITPQSRTGFLKR